MRESVRRIILWAVTIAFVAIAFDLGMYFWKFSPNHRLALSQDTEEWAPFGEYVGGTLGPAFALSAFLAAVAAIADQRRQTNLTELQKLIFSVYERINSLQREKLPQLDQDAAQQLQEVTSFGDLLYVLFDKMVTAQPDVTMIWKDALIDGVALATQSQANVFQRELLHLVLLLLEYKDQGGSDSVVAFYRERYRRAVCSLHLLGLLTDLHVDNFFRPAESIAFARTLVARMESARTQT